MKQGEIARASLQSEVIRRAWESMQFKQKLLTRPREALQEMGYTLDEDVEVLVVQEHKKKLVLVLPESPLSTAQEQMMVSPLPPPTMGGCPIPPVTGPDCPPETLVTVSQCQTEKCEITRTPECYGPRPSVECAITKQRCPDTNQCPSIRACPTASSCPPPPQPTLLFCSSPPGNP